MDTSLCACVYLFPTNITVEYIRRQYIYIYDICDFMLKCKYIYIFIYIHIYVYLSLSTQYIHPPLNNNIIHIYPIY